MGAVLAGETITLPRGHNSSYGYSHHSFGIFLEGLKPGYGIKPAPRTSAETTCWFSCRESFHSYIDRQDVYGPQEDYSFGVHINQPEEEVVALVARVEDHLGFEPSTFNKATVFLTQKQTTNAKLLLVKPSKSWRECPIRHQLLSIILRAGNTYKHANNIPLIDAICVVGYAAQTKPAVQRFLDGFTHFGCEHAKVGPGWARFFKGDFRGRVLSQEELENSLLKEKPTSFYQIPLM